MRTFRRFAEESSKGLFYVLCIGPFVGSVVLCALNALQIVDREAMVRALLSWAGAWSPFVAFMLQAAQAVFLPMQNFFVNVTAGHVLGWKLGFLVSHAGWTVGACLVYWRGAALGSRYLPKRAQKLLGSLDRLFRKNPKAFLVAMIVPGISDDVVVWVVGLHKSVSFRKFFWTIFLTGWVGKLSTALLGDGIAQANWYMVAFYVVVIVVALPLYGLRKHRTLFSDLKKFK